MRVLGLACVAIAAAACGGGGDGGGGTQPPPQVASVVITSPASAQTIAPCATVNFAAQARDAQNNPLSNATITWEPTGTALSFSSTSGASTSATGVGVGSSTVTAKSGSVTSSGVAVTVAANNPASSADVAATTTNTFSPSCVVVRAGGTVNWVIGSVTHNVQFQGTKPAGGDIGNRENATESRTFPAAGSYPYVCTLHSGMTGRVVVVQ